MKYTDPNGRWILLDDFIFSLLDGILNNDTKNLWQKTKDSFIYSWKHPIERGKEWGALIQSYRTILDENFGIDGFISHHTDWSDKVTSSINIDVKTGTTKMKIDIHPPKKKKEKSEQEQVDEAIDSYRNEKGVNGRS